MNEEINARLDTLERKIDAICVSVEKTRKYFLWMLVATIVMFVLPLLGIIFILPWFTTALLSGYGI